MPETKPVALDRVQGGARGFIALMVARGPGAGLYLCP